MNLAFILQSFGVKLSAEEVEAITETARRAPTIFAETVARVVEIERKVNFLYDIAQATHAPRDQREAEYQRQFALALYPLTKELPENEQNRNRIEGGGDGDGSAAIAAE